MGAYCTNCGKKLTAAGAACTRCGFDPTEHPGPGAMSVSEAVSRGRLAPRPPARGSDFHFPFLAYLVTLCSVAVLMLDWVRSDPSPCTRTILFNVTTCGQDAIAETLAWVVPVTFVWGGFLAALGLGGKAVRPVQRVVSWVAVALLWIMIFNAVT
jgi:hypothetical protein